MKTALTNLEDIRQGQHIIDLVNGYVTYGLVLGFPGIIGLLLVFVTLCAAMLMARRRLEQDDVARDIAAFVFSVGAFSIVSSFFTSFGGENSTPFYEVAALGACIYAIQRRVTAATRVPGGAIAAPVSSIQATIAQGRAAAKERARRLRETSAT